MITKNIKFKNFLFKYKNYKINTLWTDLLKNEPKFLASLKPGYEYGYTKKIISKYRKFKNIKIIGMGGSTLGTEAIYNFLRQKIKKKSHL